MTPTYKKFTAALIVSTLLVPMFAAAQTPTNADTLRAREHAKQEIDRRLQILSTTTERIQKVRRLNNSFQSQLRLDLSGQAENLRALRARLASSTNPERVRSDIESVSRSYNRFAILVPKTHIATAAEKIVTITAIMSEMGLKLKNRIDAAEANGADTTTLVEALASLSVHIDSANAHAQMAIRTIAELNADRDDTTELRANQAKLKAAREQLRLAHEEVKGGRQDIGTIINGLKRLQQASSGTSEDD